MRHRAGVRGMADRRLALLGALLVGVSVAFLVWHLRAPMDVILGLRATKLAALIVVGAAIGASTILFQTVAANRLLTPGIVGFDALFVFIQTALVMGLGASGYALLPPLAQFAAETVILLVAAMALFGVVLRHGAEDILRLVLTGVILGVLLRTLAGLMQRLLDPSEFAILQQASIATFNAVDADKLMIGTAVLMVSLCGAMVLARQIDLAALGRSVALPLGLDHDRVTLLALALVALMVAVATALVGPITFLGLLAASLAHAVMPTYRHDRLIPAAAIIGAIILVAGQFIFERLLGMRSSLTVIVECLGGLLFLFLILRKAKA